MADAKPEEMTSTRYQVLGRLAGGGMADIYLARATSEGGIERHVVLKRVLAERARDPNMIKMFLDEARLAVQLQHANIAQVFDFGKLGGSYFFTMEYVHGADVRALLQRLGALKKQLPLNLALHIATSVLAGLHHAHTRTGPSGKPLGVVHRDVSPSNVMVSFDGGVKLLDFGVAKATQNTAESRTGVKGKIGYLSPEQCRCRPLDLRSDIYSMGIVLHEMLTTRRLYRRESDFETMQAIVEGTPPKPSSVRPEVSPALDAIVLKALAKDPAQRFASAAEMAEELELVAAAEGHRVSTLATGKFMRELYGERPEPWAELATAEGAAPLTITRESAELLPFGEPQLAPAMAESLPIELARAPLLDLRPEDSTPMSLPSMRDGPRDEPSSPPFAPVFSPVESPSAASVIPAHAPGNPATPVMVALPSLVEPSSKSNTPLGSSKRRGFVVIGGFMVGGAAIGIVVAATSSSKEIVPDAAVASTPEDAALVEEAALLEPDAPVIAITPDAAVITPPTAPPPSIKRSFDLADWNGTLLLCAKRKPAEHPVADRERCGVAACNAKQKITAARYHASAGSARVAIERACKARGFVLGGTVARPPPKDPCETNPLRCQK